MKGILPYSGFQLLYTDRLAKCHHPHPPGWCKIFTVWVNLVTEHTVFCHKFYLLLEFSISFSKSSMKWREYYFWSIFFCKLIMIYKCISMILSDFFCILLLTVLCCKFGISKNHTLFAIKIVSLKPGWCKENDILQVCVTQTKVFTLSWIREKFLSTDNGFTIKSDVTQKFSTQTIPLPSISI